MKTKKYLVTGGTGFIGFHIAKKLSKLGYKTTSLSTSKPKITRKTRGVKYITCDVTKKKIFNSKLKENFDYVIMTNRAAADKDADILDNVKGCFEKVKGEDLVTVERNGLMLSTLRKRL